MDYGKQEDDQLVAMLREGNGYAYTELFERYHLILLKHAFRLLSNNDEAYDVVQDVFLKLWQNREAINITGSVSAYLYIAVRNRIFKHFAHQQVVLRYAESISAFMLEGYDLVEDPLLEKELASLIDREINTLPAKMREVFLLNKKEGLSYKEIAERLSITDQTAKQQVYKAMKILKPKIDGFLSIFPFL